MVAWTYDGLAYRRRVARTVRIGAVEIGSEHPVRVQSMTTPSTRDTPATVTQIERLVDAGCEIVRLTVPTNADAENLPTIREKLKQRRIHVPLVADIHFTPRAAMKAVEYVDKVRINPGNYADKKKFNVREYSDAEYGAELERIAGVFTPLVRRARELGVSMRIGTNHGSLSDRIMNRYGDTPEGMVESAMEFVRICEAESYHELVLSMKSSNPVVVQQVYRLLAQRMAEESMDYPFHLGVTEAGDGEDGRVKSALGIGALLDEGIGDTIRVSLTEDPVAEIPVARALAKRYNSWHETGAPAPIVLREPVTERRDPFGYERRSTRPVRAGVHTIGGGETVKVEVSLQSSLDEPEALRRELDGQCGTRVPEETRAEIVSVRASRNQLEGLETLRRSMELVAPNVALSAQVAAAALLGIDANELRRWCAAAHRLHIVTRPSDGADGWKPVFREALETSTAIVLELEDDAGDTERAVDHALTLARIANGRCVLTLTPREDRSILHSVRLLTARLDEAGLDCPLLLLDRPLARNADPLLDPAAMLGGLLCDGIGDAIQVVLDDATEARRTAFGILQAARVRITKTEFISCPSCGRTLFDLEETTARIKQRTSHLKGLKIAVMGCVVNGPGEMADADFGYVGWGEDKIALFVGKEMVARDIPTATADQRLVELIKEHGRWVEPPVAVGEEA
jgi:(E)-4-hydroxy-3-methylbut-2-enyl-diphosphate synthase